MDFSKGTKIEDIFDKLFGEAFTEKFKKYQEDAENKIMALWNNAPPQGEVKSARHVLMDILQDGPMKECGCCYKVPMQTFDLAAVELAAQKYTIEEITKLCEGKDLVSTKDILKIIDKEHRMFYTMTSGIRELIRAGKELYITTMANYANRYRRNNPLDEPGAFDNVLGMHVAISEVVERKTKQ